MHLAMRAPARLLALVAMLTLGTAGVASAHGHHGAGHHGRSHGHHGSNVVGHLYVNDNTAHANTVAVYARHADGTLTPLPGSPVHTGGAGTGAALGSQGALQQTRDGRFLLAVDPGSNQVSVLRVSRDGGLAPVAGGTVGSGGTEPVSVTVSGGLVYVANAGAGGSDYTGFTLSASGHLTPLPGSTVALPDAAQPGDVLLNATDTRLVGTRVGTSQIDSFTVDRGGRLHVAPGSPYAAQGPGPFGSEFSPTAPGQLFVSNAHGGANAGTVSAFDVGRDGSLSSIGDSPFADHQTAPCWVEISRDGRRLFAVNTAVPSISSYAISRDGTLHLLGSTPFPGSASGLGPQDARLTPDGSTLWVVDTKGVALSGFRIRGGQVTPLPGAPTPLPTGSAPFGIVTN
jgi:6-phosphogluconolactonase (cycloisomerase 2 family)